MKSLLVIFLFCKSFSTYAQQVLINGTEADRNLTWSDFIGAPQPDSSYFAYTYWYLSYKYDSVRFKGDSGMIAGLLVKLQFEPKSWVKEDKESKDLLRHEQGHFDIGRLCMLTVLDTLKNTLFPASTIRTDVRTLFLSILDKYNTMGSTYDEETDHGLNRRKQKKWEAFFSAHLEQTNK